MPATDRLADERAFHDRQAHARAACCPHPGVLRFDDDDFLDHETWIRPAFAKLGDLAGLAALDFGCGHGMAAVVMARRGARVTAFDLSAGYVVEARTRAEVNGAQIDFVQADGERLPFADQTFDRVWGNAILHHLDLTIAATELRRVLRPGGIAVFCEPWGENPLLEWARQCLPYPGKQHTRDERPLRWADLGPLQAAFPSLQVEGHQLLGMVRRALGIGPVTRALAWCDGPLLRCIPPFGRLCRYVVLTLRREGELEE
jgi:SAM-dependent methyltransferase